MPSSGQSLTRPAASLSWTACQRNLPSDSRKHMTMPLSKGSLLDLSTSRGLRGFLLFVPTNTLPPATIGPPYALEPRSTLHLIFFSLPDSTLHSAGMFRSKVLTKLRLGVPPNMVQPAPAFS